MQDIYTDGSCLGSIRVQGGGAVVGAGIREYQVDRTTDD